MLPRRFLFGMVLFLASTSLSLLALAQQPAAVVTQPCDEIQGALVIVGGGSTPDDVRDEFAKLAGGAKGKLVVIPTASVNADEKSLEPWKKFNFAELTLLHTTDRKKADEARGYFDRAGVSKQITLKTGDALELLSEEKQQFDIIFNDVDKEDYPRVFKLVLPRLRKGGLFVTDNVLWSGKVAQDNSEPTTKAILEFNRLLYSSPDLFTTVLPIRDGVAVAIKN